jgi:hypothetical protein
MLNNWVNFWFSIMKELWDLAQENLVNIQGSYGILDHYLWMSAREVSHTLDMAL